MSNHIETSDLPFIVCPACAGHGTTGPGWVYTMDELDEEFGPDADEFMEDMRDGKYDILCGHCDGKRVVKGECPCDDCKGEREEEFQLREMERMERMYGC